MLSVDSQLKERLEKLVGSMGFEFVGCEIQPQDKRLIFRLYIDKAAGTGVSLDDCALVSRQVSALLDVEDPIHTNYSLEVSSPGIDRPLFELVHYQRYIGSQVKVRLHTPIDNRRNIKGLIKQVEADTVFIVIDVDGLMKEIAVPFSNIDKGHLIGEIK